MYHMHPSDISPKGKTAFFVKYLMEYLLTIKISDAVFWLLLSFRYLRSLSLIVILYLLCGAQLRYS